MLGLSKDLDHASKKMAKLNKDLQIYTKLTNQAFLKSNI